MKIKTITYKKPNLISATWQSLYKMPKEYFSKFEVVIIDEVHLAKSASLTKIMEKCENISIRLGFTGTLDDLKTNEMILIGLFGNVFKTTSTTELIEKKVLSDFKIQCLTLKYPDEERKMCKKMKYDEELDFIVRHSKRNELIKHLILKMKGNTLVLFQFVDKHGKELYNLIKNSTDRPVYYISGETKSEERNNIRKRIEKEENAILIASIATSAVGINIVSLKNIVFTSPSKAKIRTLQSIGRVLRKSENKKKAILWDISDDLSWKTRKNYTLKHFAERLKIYNKENFEYKLHSINL